MLNSQNTIEDPFVGSVLSSGADGIQADLDDSHCPSWNNNLLAQHLFYQICHHNNSVRIITIITITIAITIAITITISVAAMILQCALL